MVPGFTIPHVELRIQNSLNNVRGEQGDVATATAVSLMPEEVEGKVEIQ